MERMKTQNLRHRLEGFFSNVSSCAKDHDESRGRRRLGMHFGREQPYNMHLFICSRNSSDGEVPIPLSVP